VLDRAKLTINHT